MARRIDFKAPLITSITSTDKPLPEQVAERITGLIMDDAYRAGHKLPNEYVLAERLGVGRSTVREAIKLLASRNVLEVRHGSGTYVCESIGMVDDPLGFRFYRDKRKLALDLCDIRLMVEPPLAAAAATTATPKQVELLVRECDVVAERISEGRDHSAEDVALHKRIAEASGNLVAPGIVGIIATAIPLFVRVSNSSLLQETITTHRLVVEAIARHNGRAAAKAMQQHIENNRDNFRSLPETN
ncbi:MAG: GntR family transcriptional regulator [Planctomycetaceae bacterium]|nr:GntR family transcriptional regulator [Planctomycetaceae bacterium]